MSSGMEPLLNHIFNLIEQFKELGGRESIDWKKYNYFSIVHHSTSIEGASLTEKETQLLPDENLTAKGKPIVHHNMQTDLYSELLLYDTIPDLLASRCPRITRIYTNSNSRYSEKKKLYHFHELSENVLIL